jgi:hypothetical protein
MFLKLATPSAVTPFSAPVSIRTVCAAEAAPAAAISIAAAAAPLIHPARTLPTPFYRYRYRYRTPFASPAQEPTQASGACTGASVLAFWCSGAARRDDPVV